MLPDLALGYTMGVFQETGTAYSSRTPGFTPGFFVVEIVLLAHCAVCFVLFVFNPCLYIFQLYRDGQFYWRTPKYPKQTTLSQITDKLYHIMLY